MTHPFTNSSPFGKSKFTVWSWAFLGFLLVVTLGMSLQDFYSFQFGETPDSVEYTLLAHALVQGPQYALNYSATNPEITHFPFGYPMLLLPFVLAAPRAFELPALLSLAATLCSVAILFLGWRTLVPEVDPRWRYPICAMVALAPLTIVHSRLILSEAVFMTGFLLTLFFAGRVLRDSRRRDLWIALGVSAFFMIFVRSIGLVAGGAILVWLVFYLRRSVWHGLFWSVGTISLLTLLVFALTPVRPPDIIPQEYVKWYITLGPLGELAPTSTLAAPNAVPTPVAPVETGDTQTSTTTPIRANYGYIFEHIDGDLRRILILTGGGDTEQQIIARLGGGWLTLLPGLVVLGVVLLGAVRWVMRIRAARGSRFGLVLFVGGCYFLVALFWRGGGDRLWYPIQPQLFLALGLGLLTIADGAALLLARAALLKVPHRAAVTTVAILLAVWVGLALYRDFTLDKTDAGAPDLSLRAKAFDPYIPSNVLVGSDWPAFDYLYNGRQTMLIPYANSADGLSAALTANHIRYLVIAADDTFANLGLARRNNRVKEVAPYLEALVARGSLTRVYENTYPLQILSVGPAQP